MLVTTLQNAGPENAVSAHTNASEQDLSTAKEQWYLKYRLFNFIAVWAYSYLSMLKKVEKFTNTTKTSENPYQILRQRRKNNAKQKFGFDDVDLVLD